MNDNEFRLVKQRLRTLTGIDLGAYKDAQVRRRLDGYLGRVRAASWTAYLHDASKDPQALHELRDYLTINVSCFFRDKPKWDELRTRVLPRIPRRGRPLQVWSAACSVGAELYSLVMLLDEQPDIARFRVLGTDIDQAALKRAQAGGPYTEDDVKAVSPAQLHHSFRKDAAGYWVQPALRSRVTIREADLLQSTACAEFDLILCRNVLIYFTEAAKAQVIQGLAQALRPGGFLFIGATETVGSERSYGLERVGISFYQRSL